MRCHLGGAADLLAEGVQHHLGVPFGDVPGNGIQDIELGQASHDPAPFLERLRQAKLAADNGHNVTGPVTDLEMAVAPASVPQRCGAA